VRPRRCAGVDHVGAELDVDDHDVGVDSDGDGDGHGDRTGTSATHTTPISLTVNPVAADDFSMAAAAELGVGDGGSVGVEHDHYDGDEWCGAECCVECVGVAGGCVGVVRAGVDHVGAELDVDDHDVGVDSGGDGDGQVTGTGTSATHTTPISLTVNPVASGSPQLVRTTGTSETAAATTLTATFPKRDDGRDLLVLSASVYTGTTNTSRRSPTRRETRDEDRRVQRRKSQLRR